MFGVEDPMETATKMNPLVTKYIGARILSFFSLIMVVSAVALVGLAITGWSMYHPVIDNLKSSYLKNGASNTHQESLLRFLDTGVNARVLFDHNVSYGVIFTEYPAILSITTIPTNASSEEYFVISRSSAAVSGVDIVDHSPNCLSSNVSGVVCDTTMSSSLKVSESAWYQLGFNLNEGTSDAVWNGPYGMFYPSTNQLINTIDYIWRSTLSDGNFTLARMSMNLAYLALPEDPMLDGNGTQRVWIIDRTTRSVLTGLGVDPSFYLSLTYAGDGSGTYSVLSLPIANVSSVLTDGQWILQIKNNEYSSQSSLEINGLVNHVSASIFPVNGTNFSVVCATNSSPFENTTFTSLFMAILIIAIFPIVATVLVWAAYLLRLEAIRKKKMLRKADLMEITKAIETAKKAKLSKEVMNIGIDAKSAGGLSLLRSSAVKKL